MKTEVGRPNKAMGGSDDPTKWLCRKHAGYWWIWRPFEYLPIVQLTTFTEVLEWRPAPRGFDSLHEENVWRAAHGLEQL